MPVVASSLLSSSCLSWHRRLSSSSCPGWHLHCRLPHACRGIVAGRLPHAQRGVHGVLRFRSPRLSVCAVVFRSAQRSLRYAQWSSVPLRCGIHSSVLLCLAWPSLCASVFHSARCSIRGGVPFCLARLSVYVAIFHSARCSIRGIVSFCPAPYTRWCSVLSGVAFDMRGCPLFRSARYTRQGSFLSGAAIGMRSGLRFRSAQHTQRCSILSGAARCMRRCCGYVISGPGLLVTLRDDPVVIGVSDLRSRRWFLYAAKRYGKVPRSRCIDNRISMSFVVGDPGSLRRAAG